MATTLTPELRGVLEKTIALNPPRSLVIATKMVELGAHVIFLEHGQKGTKESGWQDKATRDLAVIAERAALNPTANVGVVGKPDGLWFFDDDKNILAEYEQLHGVIPTYRVRSVSGGVHLYFVQNELSRAMGNVNGTNDEGEETWSARVLNRYVVSAGSTAHPNNDNTAPEAFYQAVDKTVKPIEAPESFIQFLKDKAKPNKTGHVELDSTAPIAQGGRNNELTKILGKARQVMGMDAEELYNYGVSVNNRRCKPPLAESEVRTIANSMARYDVKPSGVGTVLLGDTVVGQEKPAEVQEYPKPRKTKYPVFPDWVMHGTSIYEGFVKPWCDTNNRIPYFMFLPTAAMMMNYLGTKVTVEQSAQIPSFFMILIGEKGRAIKSSSVEDGIEYLQTTGIIRHASDNITNAEGKSLVWTAGSPEGLGMEMGRTNCKNAVLFYDELSLLLNKAEIDSSALRSSLLSLYESGKFSNTIKSRKERYSIDPRSYCASLITCTTDENFEDLWSRMAGKSSGLNDRFMFVLQPEVLPPFSLKTDVNTVQGAMLTKQRIDKAVLQRTYQFEDRTQLENSIAELGNRTEIRAEKWALYFAIDLGHDTITESDVERGLAVARYELAVKKHLGSPEAETKIAAAQIKYRKTLERLGGRVEKRVMARTMSSHRYGSEGWWRIEEGLKKAGTIAEIAGNNYHDPTYIQVRELLPED